MKKVEIVVEESVLDKIVDVLNEHDLLTQAELVETKVIEHDALSEDRIFSSKTAKGLSIICSNTQKDKIVARLFPLVTILGGFCVSHDLYY